jgi:chromosome segregation ATPase
MTDDDFSDLVEECNSPASKRIEQLERELAEARNDATNERRLADMALAHRDIIIQQRDELSGHYHRLNAENVILQQQRDMLAEALQAFMRWADYVDIPNEVQKMCHQALAAVKGGTP